MRIPLNFHAGEVSPFVYGRGDLPALKNACSLLRNMIPRAIGGAVQRPGTWWRGLAHTQNAPSRLLPFSFNSSQSYRLELGDRSMRFWIGTRLCVTPPPPQSIETPGTVNPGTLGQAVARSWFFNGTNQVTNDTWLAVANSTAPNRVQTGSLVPPPLANVTWNAQGAILDGVQWWTAGHILTAFFKAPTTGSYTFRINAAKGARFTIKCSDNEGAEIATAQVVLDGLVGGEATPTTVTGTVALNLTANLFYAIEFQMLRTLQVQAPGTFQFRVGAGAWQNFVAATHLAPIIETPGAPVDEETSVMTDPGEILRLETPWTPGQLRAIQIAQANDVVWLAHGSSWPRRLIRHGAEDWRMMEMPVKYAPLRDPNIDVTILLTPSATTGDNITVTSNKDVFEAADVGGYYEIAHRREVPHVERSLQSTGTSADVRIQGRWEVYSFGKWTGTLKLKKRRAGTGATETVAAWSSKEDFNIQATGELDGDEVMFLDYVATVAGSGTPAPRATLSALDAEVRGMVKITGFTDKREVTAKVIRALYSTEPTWHWAEGAWSVRRGFPNSVCLLDQRLTWGGNRSEPQKVWMSAKGGFDDYERTTIDDSAFTFQIAATRANPIQAMVSQPDGLFIFTTGDEWIVNSGPAGGPITPQNRDAKKRSENGSEPVQPLVANGSLLFVEAGGKSLAEHLYNQEIDGFDALNLSELAEHLALEGIVELAYAPKPHGLVWAVTAEGSLLSLTFQRKNGALAWAKHTTYLGAFESVCVTPGANGLSDTWVVVNRGGVRSVEQFSGHWRNVLQGGSDMVMDAAVEMFTDLAEPQVQTEWVLPDQFPAVGVNIVADDVRFCAPDFVEGGGPETFLISTGARKVVVGRPVIAEIGIMPVDVNLDTGSAVGRKFRVAEVDVRFLNSAHCQYGVDRRETVYGIEGVWHLFPIQPDDTVAWGGDSTDPVVFFSGLKKVAVPGQFLPETRFWLMNTRPFGLNVTGLVIQLAIHGQ